MNERLYARNEARGQDAYHRERREISGFLRAGRVDRYQIALL